MEKPRLTLLGRPEYRDDLRLASRVRSHRVWALLGLLALNRGEWVSRESIADQLWPDTQRELANQRLRQTLLYVRDALGSPSWLLVQRTSLKLNDDQLEVDIWETESRSGFLDGLSDEWIQEVRRESDFKMRPWDEAPAPLGESDYALTLLPELDGSELINFLRGQLPIWVGLGKFAAQISALEKERQTRDNPPETLLLTLADLHLRIGNYAAAQSLIAECRINPALNPQDLGWMHYLQGHLFLITDRGHLSIHEFEEAMRILKGADALTTLRAMLDLAYATMEPLDRKRMFAISTKGIALAKKINDPIRRVQFEILEATCDLLSGRPKDAKSKLLKVVNPLMQSQRPGLSGGQLSQVGRMLIGLGETVVGDQCIEEGLRQVSKTDHMRIKTDTMTYAADRLQERGDPQSALTMHLEALSIRRRGLSQQGIATSLRGAGSCSLELGLHHQAYQYLRESLEAYERIGDELGLASAVFQLAKLFQATGETRKSRKCAEAVRDILTRHDPIVVSAQVPSKFLDVRELDQLAGA